MGTPKLKITIIDYLWCLGCLQRPTDMHISSHTHTHTHSHEHMHTHTHTHTHTHMNTCTHTHTHSHTHTQQGLRISNFTLPLIVFKQHHGNEKVKSSLQLKKGWSYIVGSTVSVSLIHERPEHRTVHKPEVAQYSQVILSDSLCC